MLFVTAELMHVHSFVHSSKTVLKSDEMQRLHRQPFTKSHICIATRPTHCGGSSDDSNYSRHPGGSRQRNRILGSGVILRQANYRVSIDPKEKVCIKGLATYAIYVIESKRIK